MKLRKYTISSFLFLFMWFCTSVKQYTNKKSTYLLDTSNESIELNAMVFHANDSVSDIYVELKNNHLLYKRTDTSTAFYAEVKVICSLYADEGSKSIIDSSSFIFIDRDESELVEAKVFNNKFKIKAKYGNQYHLKIEAIDLNRKTIRNFSYSINKRNHSNLQNYLLYQGGLPAYKNTFTKQQLVQVVAANASLKKLYVDVYSTELKPASPPFSKKPNNEQQLKPDSSFELNNTGGRFLISMPNKGFYFMKASAESDLGFGLFTYDAAFPSISSLDEMIFTCRYLMYKEEYDSCRLARDKKVAIDKFWLNIGGSHERAREVLKQYYQRVKEANQNYSSYMEGWKTDKGMIYIVFGPPSNVYKSIKDEIWVYGLETNPSALRFVFKKTDNPLSDNDYVLERSEFYKEAYYQAVDYWRQGIVYKEKGLDR